MPQVSLLPHWQSTFARFAPDMTIHMHTSASTDDAAAAAADVVITTPSMLLQPRSSHLRARKYWRLVVDEAHLVSNPRTAIHQALCGVQCVHVWCVTGTPLQNASGDMRALLQLCGVDWARLPMKEAMAAAAGARGMGVCGDLWW